MENFLCYLAGFGSAVGVIGVALLLNRGGRNRRWPEG